MLLLRIQMGRAWGCSSVVEQLPGMYKALGITLHHKYRGKKAEGLITI